MECAEKYNVHAKYQILNSIQFEMKCNGKPESKPYLIELKQWSKNKQKPQRYPWILFSLFPNSVPALHRLVHFCGLNVIWYWNFGWHNNGIHLIAKQRSCENQPNCFDNAQLNSDQTRYRSQWPFVFCRVWRWMVESQKYEWKQTKKHITMQ